MDTRPSTPEGLWGLRQDSNLQSPDNNSGKHVWTAFPCKRFVDVPLTLLLCIRSLFGDCDTPDQDGKSRAQCLIRSSALEGHAPRQTHKTPIGRWSIFTPLADSFSAYRVHIVTIMRRRVHCDGIDRLSSGRPMRCVRVCLPSPRQQRLRMLFPSSHRTIG